MIKEQGVVIDVKEQFIWVETSVKSSCSSCAAKSNCGTGAIARSVAGKTVVNVVENHLNAKNGDLVEIGIDEDTLLSGAFYLYILPLVTAMAAAFSAQFWLANIVTINEPFVILITLLGGFIGFRYARYRFAKLDESTLNAKLLKVLDSPIAIKEIN